MATSSSALLRSRRRRRRFQPRLLRRRKCKRARNLSTSACSCSLAVVDLACMRDAMKNLGEDPNNINPLVPVDLVVDHFVQVDVARSENAVQAYMEHGFQRNKERFAFLKWGSSAFHNMLVVPPGLGIVHQVNLEYLGMVVFNTDGTLYPDSGVGTDSHTTMIDGLGVAGWGVGGIEAEATMLGQPMSMVLPGVVGF
ncbi:hypothetical protein CMV_011110 [Castanea mollissima]|uniref:Aconitase/3-isopropylmalate dehydratase large subunit alpha/beta/alpha domain-containing protein n=1 Tax=Castanea mollissima TaxID=60419 RepID=A0A8J4RLW2_9ROSI|nr:hypothetical protein CMV_011110 [Castanea mollissima]